MPRPSSLVLLLALAPAVQAQTASPSVTAEDYARAERFLAQHTEPLVLRADVRPRWLPDGRFWYGSRIEGGTEFVMVDPAGPTRARDRKSVV